MSEKRRIAVGGIMALIAGILLMSTAEAISIHRSPENISVSFIVTRDNLSQSTSQVILLTSNEVDIIDEIRFESEYVISYTPEGSILSPSVETAFTVQIGVDSIDENMTIDDFINVTGEIDDVVTVITQIPLKLEIGANLEPLRDYLFRKCFVEEGMEYCAEINLSDITNVTIIEINETNNTFNVLLPMETSQEFFNNYAATMADLVTQMEQISKSVEKSTNESMRLQDQLNRDFQNAGIIEKHLRDKVSPLWYEVEPVNTLINSTGLSSERFLSAMRIMTEEKMITEKFEDTWQVKNLPNGGVLTTQIKKKWIASADRLEEERLQGGAITSVMGSTALLILVGGAMLILNLRKKNMIKTGV